MDEQTVETTLYSLSDDLPRPSDRRSGERHLTLLRVGSLTIGDRRELCLIRNLSAGGMLIRAYSQIREGETLSVELKQGEAVAGRARWVQDDSVGVIFDDPIDVLDLLSASLDGPKPRMPRVEVEGVAWVREGAVVARASVRDVSQGGAKIETSKALTVGGEVVVTLSGLAPVSAVVRWRDGDLYGVTFVKVVALPLLVGWLHEQRDRMRAAS